MPDTAPPGLDAFLEEPAAPAPAPIGADSRAPAASSPPPAEPPGLDDFVASEKYGTPGQTALAGLEGAASGLTFGGSRLAEIALFDNAAEQKGRMEASPVVSPGSTALGAILPIVATAGAAAPEELAVQAAARGLAPAAEGAIAAASRQTLPYLAARAGKAISAAAGEGVLGRALGMGAEGAAYGAGNAVSDLALGDPHLTGQKVLADFGMGAAFGAGLGVLSKGLEAALPAATKKLTGSLSNLKELVFGTSGTPSTLGSALKTAGAAASGENPTDWADAFYTGLQGVDKPSEARGLVKNLQGVWDSAKEAATDLYEKAAPENIGRALEEMPVQNAKVIGVDALNKVSGMLETAGENGEIKSLLSSPQNAKLVGDRLERLTGELSAADTAFDVHRALDKFEDDLRGLIKYDTLPTAGQIAEQGLLREVRDTVRGVLKDTGMADQPGFVHWGEAAQHYAQASDEYAAYKTASKQFAQSFMRKDPGTKKLFVDPAKVSAFFNQYGSVGQDARKEFLNGFLNQAQSLAKASENYHGFEAAEGSISKRVSELARQNKEFTDVAAAIKSRAAGQTRGRLGELGLGYAAHAVGVPSPIVGAAIGGIEAYKAIKNPYELGSTLHNTFQKLQVLGDVAEGVNKKITSLSKSVFGAPEGRIVPLAQLALADDSGYDKRAARVSELAENPKALMDHLDLTTKGIYEAAPNVTQGVQASMISAVQFLSSKVPRPPNEMILSPDWEPSQSQKEDFNRYYEAVDKPMSAFKEIKDGTLSNEMIETLQTVYPKLLGQMQQGIAAHLMRPGAKDLNDGTKIALSKFMGQPLDESMMPAVIASNQAAFQMVAPQTIGSPRKVNKSTLGGLKQLNLADRRKTSAQEEKDNET